VRDGIPVFWKEVRLEIVPYGVDVVFVMSTKDETSLIVVLYGVEYTCVGVIEDLDEGVGEGCRSDDFRRGSLQVGGGEPWETKQKMTHILLPFMICDRGGLSVELWDVGVWTLVLADGGDGVEGGRSWNVDETVELHEVVEHGWHWSCRRGGDDGEDVVGCGGSRTGGRGDERSIQICGELTRSEKW